VTLTLDRPAGRAEQALHDHGFTGERLLKLAHRIANDELRRRGAHLGNRYEDLVMWLVEVACTNAPRYEQHNGYTFDSWLADLMAHRVIDFYRRKGEGFGDRRKGHDQRIHLTDDPEPADHDLDFDTILNDRKRARWQQAANQRGWTLAELIVIATDHYARGILQEAA
jgi:DNA-directed RNA polymerase specialized sigma24 family protein